MLEIERVGWLKGRYMIRLDQGHSGFWERRRFKESMTGEIDGEPYGVERDGRRHFVLLHSGRALARADAGTRGDWTISAGHSSYELGRRSAWSSEMQLRSGGVTVGSIRRVRSSRGTIRCELPSELSAPVQVFIGLLVVILRARAAASSGAASASVTT